jgi:alkaline phosphatase
MAHFLIKQFLLLTMLTFMGGASRVLAQPKNVKVMPPNGARFVVGQKFDLRVEGEGTGPFSATLAIDGKPLKFTSGEQDPMHTDGISKEGYGGFNLRGYFNEKPGKHRITATFTSNGKTTPPIEQTFEIIDVRGSSKPARNIIIMLGDGMGAAHRSAARIVRYGVTAGTPNDLLAMDKFPGTGLITTYSLNSIVTDSAPGMACYSTGNHADNNQEGVFPANVKNPFHAPRVEYMSEYLHRKMGKSLGLVTTADVEDATPAANAVHTADRNAGTGICDQYLDESDWRNTRKFGTGLTVLMGGGRRWFLSPNDPVKECCASSRSKTRKDSTTGKDLPIDYVLPKDLTAGWNLPPDAAGEEKAERDLLGDFRNAGFTYVDTFRSGPHALKNVGTPDKLLGLFAFGNMNAAMDKIDGRRGKLPPGGKTSVVEDYYAADQPMLDEMTEVALRVLNKNSNGFVLLVEGAHIDKQSHLMDADRVIDEVIEFDRAVAVARKFADEVGNTIIVVLADHECSGFSIIGALKGGEGGINRLENLPPDNTTFGPDKRPERQQTVGIYEAAGFPRYQILADGYPATFDIDGKVLFGFGANSDRYENWLTKPRPVIDSLLPDDLKKKLEGKGYVNEPQKREDKVNGFFVRGQLFENRGMTAVHTAADVPISAYSSTSQAYQLFYGVQENTDVFFKLMRAVLGGFK